MVQFNPEIRPSNDPSYLNTSKGTDTAKPIADKSMGDLFSTIGDVIGGAAKIGYQSINDSIKSSVYGDVDDTRDRYGVQAGLDNQAQAGTPGRAVPGPVKNGTESIAKLTEAYNQGQISDAHYNARLETQVRQLRTQYPGFREEIDAAVSGVVGYTPANKLRSEVQNLLDTNAAKQQAAADKWETFEHSNAEWLPKDYYVRKAEGKPYSKVETEQHVMIGKREKLEVDQQKSKYALMAASNSATSDDFQREAIKEANRFVLSEGRQAVGTALGKQLQEAQATVAKLTSNANQFDPKLIEVATTQLNQLETAYRQELNNRFKVRTINEQGDTVASKINDPQRLEKVIEDSMAPLRAIRQAITDKDTGALNIHANILKATGDADTRTFIENSDSVRRLSAARQMLGPEGMKLIAAENQTLLSQAEKAISGITLGRIASEGTPLARALADNKSAGAATARSNNDVVEKSAAILASKEVRVEGLRNHANSMFGDGNINFLDNVPATKRNELYKKFTTPEVTANMLKLRETDPGVFANYTKWAVQNFAKTMKQNIDTVNEGISNSKFYDVVVDPASGMLRAVPSGKGGNPVGDALINGPMNRAMEEINSGLRNLHPIFEGNGRKLNEELGGLGRLLDQNPPKNSGLWDKVKSALQAVGEAPEAVMKKGSDAGKAYREMPMNLFDWLGNGINLITPAKANALINLGGVTDVAEGGKHPISDFIGKAEGANYDTLYGGWKGPKIDVTETTAGDILKAQKANVQAGADSSPVGKGQFMPDTIRSLIADGVIDESTKLTPEVQEKMITALIERRKQAATDRNGNVDPERLADELAKEWASFPTRSGKSHYAGDGLNKSTVSRKALMEAIAGKA
jgi:hypothetical protein